MAKINLIYPNERVAVYGDTVTIRYETIDILSTDRVNKIVFILDEDKVETTDLKGFKTFSNLPNGTHVLSGYILNDNNKKVKSSDFTFNFTTINKKYKPENKLSSIVAKRVPEFIQNDHPRFVKFVEAYYEWLESSNNPYFMNISSGDFFDIDKTPDIFINRFRRQYLDNFPLEFAKNLNGDTANLKTVIKNIKQFYGAKGTEKSFKFFFRLLYDTFVEFYYPKNDLLKASASNWIERKTIKLLCSNINLFHSAKGRILYQATTDNNITFTARVVSVQVYKHEELTIAEMDIVSENGSFDKMEKVYCDLDEERIIANPIQVINSITILNGGFGYKVGDIVTATNESTSNQQPSGKPAKGKVVKVGQKGNILKIEMTDTGSFSLLSDSSADMPISFSIDSLHGGNAVLTADYTGITTYPGYYGKKQGHISFNKKLQDNRRYQDLSYVLRTDMMLQDYIVLLKTLVHPAGFYVGGDIILKAEFENVAFSGNGIVREVRNLIGNYVAYRLDCDFNIRNFDPPSNRLDLKPNKLHGDLFPNGFDPTDPIPEQTIQALNSSNDDLVFLHNIDGDNTNRLNEGVSEVRYTNIPDGITDTENLNLYWVVFPHPGIKAQNTDQEMDLKAINQLTINEFIINSKNDIYFNLSNG
jgi:hypothetical protein